MATDTYKSKYRHMRWYAERDRVAIVKFHTKATSVEDMYLNLEVGTNIRIYGAKIADEFTQSNDELLELPEQFHEAIVYKAIATGYEIPPNLQPEMALYFKGQYDVMVKKAKRWKRTGRVGGWKTIKPLDF